MISRSGSRPTADSLIFRPRCSDASALLNSVETPNEPGTVNTFGYSIEPLIYERVFEMNGDQKVPAKPKNSRVTGPRAATAAARTLTNSKATRTEKSAAGSALSQTLPKKQRTIAKGSSKASSVNVGVVKPTVKKEHRAASVSATAAVRTKKSVDFVKVVRGR